MTRARSVRSRSRSHWSRTPATRSIIPAPGWFCYDPMLYAANLVPVPAALDPTDFSLDIDAIARAITPRTRVVIVNSPSNPTGQGVPEGDMGRARRRAGAASRTHGRRIWLLSDEPYRRIRFDGIGFASPVGSYPWTMIDYSYGKVLLAPGQRLGYLALSPLLPASEREELRGAFMPIQLAIGWGFPNALMQYSVPALESVSIDMAELTRKRDRLYGALSDAGYTLTRPEGTFYLWGGPPATTLRRTATPLPSGASTSCPARSSTVPSISASPSRRRWR